MNKLTTATAALLLSTGTALAGTMYEPTPEPPVYVPQAPAHDWTGGYVGLFGGVATGSNFWAERGVDAESDPDNWSGTPWGVMLGYNVQRDNMVFGGEFDYTGGTLRAASTTSADFGCGVGGECVTQVDRMMSLRARVGIARDRTVIFGSAGVAVGRVTGTTGGGATVHGQETRTGWAASAGIERAMSDRFSVRGEYIHTNLGRTELPNDCFMDCFTDVSFGVFRIGGAFNF